MRLVKVAKALGMTGQELRHELTKVDLGVKPTDREIPDNLAQGILRYVARQRGIELDMEALGFGGEEEKEAESTESTQESSSPKESEVQEVEKEKGLDPTSKKAASKKADSLNVLRKLTLDDVSKEAIQVQEKKIAHEEGGPKLTKKEMEERRLEEKAMAAHQKKGVETNQEQIKEKAGVVMIPSELTVKEFAEKVGVQVPKVVSSLMSSGVMATVNQTIDYDTAAIVADELGIKVQKVEAEVSAEQLISGDLENLIKDEPENLEVRPPVVVIMGHVDHGKTAILDAIRETNVVASEAGGITQHVGAYQVKHTPAGTEEEHTITFLDTPGHEAFTAMRARGAQVGDLAVIVVSAEEGVKPTTKEAVDHARAADVPMIVAINKIDKENADPDRVKGELAGLDLQPEEWGGKTPTIHCSAVTKQGIPDLLDAIVLQAEILELKANPNRSAVATVIESHLDSSLGPLATTIVNTGTLRCGDSFVCGGTVGKVRTMMDAGRKRLEIVSPSGTAQLSGFDAVPRVGDILQVAQSEKQARELRDALEDQRERQKKRSFADLVTRLSEGKLKQLKVVLKADTQGSLDAIQDSLSKQATKEASVKVIHSAIGAVSDSDVALAAASDGVVIAFNVAVSVGVRRNADRDSVEIREYDVIYNLLDDVVSLMKGLVEPEEEEKVVGRLEVKAVFLTKRKDQIVGGKVITGTLKRLPFRVIRGEGDQVVGTGRITSLKHVDKDIKEAKEGSECGMRVETTITIEEGDVLEVFVKELKKKE